MTRDDVNFSKARTVPTRKNCVPASSQFGAREILAHFSEELPLVLAHAAVEAYLTPAIRPGNVSPSLTLA